MASSAQLVRGNFILRIGDLSATSTIEPSLKFINTDPLRLDPGTVKQRHYSVVWLGSEEENQLPGGDAAISDDKSNRTAVHNLAVEVYYKADKLDFESLNSMILQDRHDLIKALREPDDFDGFDAGDKTKDIGLWDRVRLEDEIDRSDEEQGLWVYRSLWRCTVNEVEVDVVSDYGSMYISTPAATTIGAGELGTFEKAQGTTTSGLLSNFTMPANNRLTYTGSATKVFNITVATSSEADVNNTVVDFALAKTGTNDATTTIDRKMATGGDHGSTPLCWLISLATNDYIELFLTADKASDVTVDHMTVVITNI